MMHQLNTLLGQHDQLHRLKALAEANALINAFWQSAVPEDYANLTTATCIEAGTLVVFTSNASIASKIKLTQASLLKALENSQKTNNDFKHCKVTAIKVKVQVKSTPRPRPKRAIKLSASGAQHLRRYADTVQGTALGDILKSLAAKAKS